MKTKSKEINNKGAIAMKKLNIKINNKELKLNKKTVIKTTIAIAFTTSLILNSVLSYKLIQSNLLLDKYSHIAQKLVTHIETINTQVKDQERQIEKVKELGEASCK